MSVDIDLTSFYLFVDKGCTVWITLTVPAMFLPPGLIKSFFLLSSCVSFLALLPFLSPDVLFFFLTVVVFRPV